MNDENDTKNLAVINALSRETGLVGARDADIQVSALTGDGSSRRFWRIGCGNKSLCLAVAPPSLEAKDMAEAKASRYIGLHLFERGVRVPTQYAWNEEHGVLLFEDLGDSKLYGLVLEKQGTEEFSGMITPLYKQVLKGLVHMQVQGAEGFDSGWCWDTPSYDKNVMLERESGYFLHAFWQELMGREEPAGLQEEFIYLADQAALIPAGFFLHRDFQSRNIMLYQDEPYFIDFQGGRLGPLGYDLASLLIDPYVTLSDDFQVELLEIYLDELEEVVPVDRRKFINEYLLLALQRNLQIVGAFAFLSKQRKKVFFSQFLRPALVSLNRLLNCEIFREMLVLRKMVSSAEKDFR